MGNNNLLIVENDMNIAVLMRIILERYGYRVNGIVSSGEEAIEATARMKPDVVLMDIGLKGKMCGIEAANRIMKDNGIPIVYVTAYADKYTMFKAKQGKPIAYITKPFTGIDLKEAVEGALGVSEVDMVDNLLNVC